MKIIFATICMIFAFTMVSHAGQWQQDDKGYKYRNDDGTYKTRWYQDVDGKWYYFDEQSGYMLINTVTPDGYIVLPDGKWDEGSAMNLGEREDKYIHNIQISVSKYSDPTGVHDLGYSIPVTVCYNDEYDLGFGATMSIDGIEISKDGIAYINYHLKAQPGILALNTTYSRQLSDGTTKDEKGSITIEGECGQGAVPLMPIVRPANPQIVHMGIYLGEK